MKQLQVKILCQVITAQYGTLNTGAIIRTDETFAKHLVDDCGAAEYVKPVDAGTVAVEGSKPRQPRAPKVPASKPADKPAESDGTRQSPAVQTSAQEPLADGVSAPDPAADQAAVTSADPLS